MKAKEYHADFLKNVEKEGEKEAMITLITDFFNEVHTIADIRHVKSDAGMISIVKELNTKWNALCRLDQRLKRNGFIEFVKYRIPEIKKFI